MRLKSISLKQSTAAALAAMMLVGPIAAKAAGTGREGRPRAEVDRQAREAREGAREAGRGGTIPAQVTATVRALEANRLLPRLSPQDKARFEANLAASPVMLEAATALGHNVANGELAEAALEGLTLIRTPRDETLDEVTALNADAQMDQAYYTLVTKAAQKSIAWAPELRANMLYLLTETNAGVKRGLSTKDAITEANAKLARDKGVRLDVKDINKYCL